MFLIIYLFLIIGCIVFRKNKFMPILSIIFLVALFYIKTDIPDYENYENIYNYISNGNIYKHIGIGFFYICKVCSYIIRDFRVFKTIVILISLIIMNKIAKHYLEGEDLNTFWSLYLIYSSLLDGIQFRFLLAYTILIFATIKIFEAKRIKNKIIGVILVIISCTIHSSCIFFLFIYALTKGRKQKIIVTFIALIICSFILIAREDTINLIQNTISTERITDYIVQYNSVSIIGMIIYSIILLINASAINSLSIKLNVDNEKTMLELLKKLNVLMLLIIPLLLFDTNFIARLIRPIWIINILEILNVNKKEKSILKIFKVNINPYIFLYGSAIIYNLIFLTAVSFSTFQRVLL